MMKFWLDGADLRNTSRHETLGTTLRKITERIETHSVGAAFTESNIELTVLLRPSRFPSEIYS
jgi:hypothetical protein